MKYCINFLSYWHCGSGLSGGAATDATVIKDSNNLPFVPGKTMKGLVRESVEELAKYDNNIDCELLLNGLGEESSCAGTMFFSNAELSSSDKDRIVSEHLSAYLYDNFNTTRIDSDGVADNQSLNSYEVVVPCRLYGNIDDIPEGLETPIKNSLKMIKRLGFKRNRGLGRCEILIEE